MNSSTSTSSSSSATDTDSTTTATTNQESIFLYSGHFPTIWGLLSALNDIGPMNLETIPNYGSALIFELYTLKEEEENGQTSSYHSTRPKQIVKMLYRQGTSVLNHMDLVTDNIPLGAVCYDDNYLHGGCSLSILLDYVIETLQYDHWCTLCQNTQTDICMMEQQQDQQQEPFKFKDSSDKQVRRSHNFVRGIFVGILIGYFVLFVFWYLFVSKRYVVDDNDDDQEGTSRLSSLLSSSASLSPFNATNNDKIQQMYSENIRPWLNNNQTKHDDHDPSNHTDPATASSSSSSSASMRTVRTSLLSLTNKARRRVAARKRTSNTSSSSPHTDGLSRHVTMTITTITLITTMTTTHRIVGVVFPRIMKFVVFNIMIIFVII